MAGHILLPTGKSQQVQTVCTEHCEILMPVCLYWFCFHICLSVGTVIRLLKYLKWCLTLFCPAASHFCCSDTFTFHTEMGVAAAKWYWSICAQTWKYLFSCFSLHVVNSCNACGARLSLSLTALYFLSLPLSHSAVWLLKPGRQTDRQCVHEE